MATVEVFQKAAGVRSSSKITDGFVTSFPGLPHIIAFSMQRYIEMVGDLESRGYSVSYNTIEIGSLGHYTNLTLKAIFNFASKLLTVMSHACNS